jgi:hypothetical protein
VRNFYLRRSITLTCGSSERLRAAIWWSVGQRLILMSDKAIAERLQVKGGRRLAILNAPEAVNLRVGVHACRAPAKAADVVLLCVRSHAELNTELVPTLALLMRGAIFWLAYPKLTSPLAGDLNRDIIRALSPTYGLRPVAQIAIDRDWSALRLKPVQQISN